MAIVDVCTGMLACNAIQAALNARHRTGKGQKVELSLYETSLAMLVNVAQNYLSAGKDGGRFGNGHPSIVPYTTYQAADGDDRDRDRQRAPVRALRGGARTSRMGAGRALQQQPGAGREPRCDRRPDQRGAGADKADTWLAKLEAVGVPCGKINSVAQALDDPHTAARRMVETVEHPVIGALKMLGIPFKFSDTACSVRRAPPTLGQHSDEILAGELGLDAKSIAQLRQEKIV